MIITSEIIQKNLLNLEKAFKAFPILKDYSDKFNLKIKLFLNSSLSNEYWKNEDELRTLREEIKNYKLNIYIDFIEYIEDCKKYGQEIFYRHKIKNIQLQKVLVENSLDSEAEVVFKNKTKATFSKFINSKKWDSLSNNNSTRKYGSKAKRYNDNLSRSSAIIANYCIQNEIELVNENFKRIKQWYLHAIPEPDLTISTEMQKTSSIIEFIISKLGENDSDFRKVNIDQLTSSIKSELTKKLLSVQKGEKIRCIEMPNESNIKEELTLNKIYEVSEKKLDYGVLKVEIINDKGKSKQYFYRNFETVSIIRDSFISSLLDEI